MRFFFDVFLVLLSTMITIRTYKQLVHFKNFSLAAYAIFICYIFNCLPIALDLIAGLPDYMSSFSEFERAAKNDTVSILYDMYISIAMIAFYIYYNKYKISENGSLLHYTPKLWIIQDLIIVSPLILYIILIGDVSDLIMNSLIDREGDSLSFGIINNLLFISLFFFCIRVFGKKKTLFSYLALLLFLVMLTLVSGKRFIVAVVLLGYLYSFICSQWRDKKSVPLTLAIGVVGGLFMAFVVYYITNIKIMGDFSGYIYSQLRIDFGREDVTKFVLMREMEGNPILEYRGESVLSLLLMVVPRAIWPTKPFPHYRYLTSELYGINLDELHSGMTPSVFEMMVANFGYVGMVIAIVLVIAIIRFGDTLKNPNLKLITLIILIQLFTQSLDVILILFYFFLFMVITKRHWINKKISGVKRIISLNQNE
jgi:hypothetical protein